MIQDVSKVFSSETWQWSAEAGGHLGTGGRLRCPAAQVRCMPVIQLDGMSVLAASSSALGAILMSPLLNASADFTIRHDSA